MAIPLELQAESNGGVPNLVERAGETKVMFKLLTKKNNKATTKELEVCVGVCGCNVCSDCTSFVCSRVEP